MPQKSDVLESKCVYYCLHAHLFSLPTQTRLMHKRKCVQTDSLWLLVDRFFFYSAEFVLFESVLGNILHIVLQPSIAEEKKTFAVEKNSSLPQLFNSMLVFRCWSAPIIAKIYWNLWLPRESCFPSSYQLNLVASTEPGIQLSLPPLKDITKVLLEMMQSCLGGHRLERYFLKYILKNCMN